MKQNQIICSECGVSLIPDHIALSKKLLGRSITIFYCINCLAKYIECEVSDLEIKIQEFKEQGCTLFIGGGK